jgi:hypothetical protein
MGKPSRDQLFAPKKTMLPPWISAALAAAAVMVALWSLSVVAPQAMPGVAETAHAQAVFCPNGQIAVSYQACGYGSQQTTCPGVGNQVLPGGCPTVCANQQIVGPGQPCPGGANTNQLYYCPGSAIAVPYGTPCNGQSGQTYVCPGTNATVAVGTPCPAAGSPTYNCPGTNITVPAGTPCSGACPGIGAVATPGCVPASYPSAPPPPPPSPATLLPAATTYMTTASYPAGWNIVAGPNGSALPGYNGTLFTLQAGNGTYQPVSPGTAMKPGAGYWAYFPSPFSGALATSSPTSVTVQVPAQQYIMIGNPGNTLATVAGADVVLVWNPTTNGYTQTNQLQPGQGGWAGSIRGAQVTITNAPS